MQTLPQENYTVIPNFVIDVLMSRLADEELKDILTIYRESKTPEEAWSQLCFRGYVTAVDVEGGGEK